MAGVNQVIIIGNLGNDPEMRTMPSGEAIAVLSVATSRQWTDKKSGEKKEVTEWHRIVLFRAVAEIAGKYLRKGSKIYIRGYLRTNKWQDPQTGQDRYTTEIIGEELQMLDRRPENEASSVPAQTATTAPSQSVPQQSFTDDDIPF